MWSSPFKESKECNGLDNLSRCSGKYAVKDCIDNTDSSRFQKNLKASVCRHICQHPGVPKYNNHSACKCRHDSDKKELTKACCYPYTKKYVCSVDLDDVMNDYCGSYRRVNQGADLIGYDKHPQSITQTDFVSKEIDYVRNIPGGMSATIISGELERFGGRKRDGKKTFKVHNSNPGMFLYRDCSNSSFKTVFQGSEVENPKSKPEYVTRKDYGFKPLDANVYPVQHGNRSEEYEKTCFDHVDMFPFMNSLEYRNAENEETKQKNLRVPHTNESCTFQRITTDYKTGEPFPVSAYTRDFGTDELGVYKGDPSLDNPSSDFNREQLRNCVNMVKLYKNLETKKT